MMTCGMRGHPIGPILDLSVGWGKMEEVKKIESFRERSSTFFLNCPAIGPVVSGGARGKVHPRR